MTINISKISQNGSGLDVEWNDGEKSNFNFMWLRDNCSTSRDKDSRHRMFNLLEVSTNIAPKQFKINTEGKLEIEWNEGNHTSYYDQKWLRENCYTINSKKKYISPYDLWDNSLNSKLSTLEIEHHEIMDSDKGLIKWLKLLHYNGIAIVKNAPIEKNSASQS